MAPSMAPMMAPKMVAPHAPMAAMGMPALPTASGRGLVAPAPAAMTNSDNSSSLLFIQQVLQQTLCTSSPCSQVPGHSSGPSC